MIDRMTLGSIPPKHHRAHAIEGPGGVAHGDRRIAYEHCFTRKGFDDAYSILYHRHSPAREGRPEVSSVAWRAAEPAEEGALHRRHFLTGDTEEGGTWLEARTPLIVSPDVLAGTARPDTDEARFFANGDGDELLFFFKGGALLETPFGVQEVHELDYVWIPRACPYRFTFRGREPQQGGTHHILYFEAPDGFRVPSQFRNPVGQLTFDAPYSHRDFGRPTRLVDPTADAQPVEEGTWTVTTKKHDRLTDRKMDRHPCDVVGWDGQVYPVTFPILAYQPKTGKYHLPPTIHITFATRDAVVCSFVPRKVDYGKDAIPCPYPHSSVDCDEMLFYVQGHFTSRQGVGPGSVSLHPSGLPHAPQPGAYERSIGTVETDELAVMMDTFKPMRPTAYALDVEDPDYMESWSPERFDAHEPAARDRRPDDDADKGGGGGDTDEVPFSQ